MASAWLAAGSFVGQRGQPDDIQPGIDEGRGEIPGVGDAVRFEPIGDGIRAITAREMVEFGRFALLQASCAASIRCCQCSGFKGFAELAEKGLDFLAWSAARWAAARRAAAAGLFSSWAKPGGHGAEGNEFFPLLRIAFEIAHAVGGGAKNFPRDRLASCQHLPEIILIEPEQSGGFGDASSGQPGDVQQQHDFAQIIAGLD